MPRLHVSEARALWDAAVPENWNKSLLKQVMFDWPVGTPTIYHPNPPAFHSIADENQTVDQQEYLALQAELIRRGESRSRLGQTRNSGPTPVPPLQFAPAPITRQVVTEVIQTAMARTHPLVVRQEQILRCAFISHLPEQIRHGIGTLSANLHPEIPTPSVAYQRKGKTKRRARMDIGFGHPEKCDELVGAIELKALTSLSDKWFASEFERVQSTPKDVMFSGLAGDFQKLLDPKLPRDAFRFSWVVTRRRSAVTPERIWKWTQSLLAPVVERLGLGPWHPVFDSPTGWLGCAWPDGRTLHLAWFWPHSHLTEGFEPVWDVHGCESEHGDAERN